MSSARVEILRRIRTATRDRETPTVARDYDRDGTTAPGSVEACALLTERLIDYRASVRETADVPAAILEALGDARSVVAPAGLDKAWVPGALVDDGTLDAYALDRVDAVVTAAAVACARTGTIALDAGPDQGRRMISLVPDRHVCVVRADQVVDSVPEMLRRLDPTRPLTLISGPSATSDIELERVEGVHGPRQLHVVLATGTPDRR